MSPQSNRVWSHPATLLICYLLAVSACLTIRPLWLDEALQLIVTTSPSMASMLRMIPINPGAVPLGYLTQRPFVLAGGPLAFWARLPSVLFSAGSCWLLIVLCRQLKVQRSTGLLAAVIFMLVPAQFRYATEARPYSEAVFFVLLSMIAIVSWTSRPRFKIAFLAVLAIVAALYTQAYAFLPILGWSAWIALTGFQRKEGWRCAIPLAALGLSCLVFLPWYLRSTRQWDTSIQISGYPQFHWTLAVGLDAFKGISGGSFLCSLALLILVALGIRSSPVRVSGLLLSSALCVVVGALAIDSVRNYFFATRQFLFAVPSLSVMAALGLASTMRASKIAGIVAGGVFAIAALTNDVTMQVNAKENWPAAANLLADVAHNGYCIQMAGADQGGVMLYSVFVPGLSLALCDAVPSSSRVALVSNLATAASTLTGSEQRLHSLGFTPTKTVAVGGTTIQMEVR